MACATAATVLPTGMPGASLKKPYASAAEVKPREQLPAPHRPRHRWHQNMHLLFGHMKRKPGPASRCRSRTFLPRRAWSPHHRKEDPRWTPAPEYPEQLLDGIGLLRAIKRPDAHLQATQARCGCRWRTGRRRWTGLNDRAAAAALGATTGTLGAAGTPPAASSLIRRTRSAVEGGSSCAPIGAVPADCATHLLIPARRPPSVVPAGVHGAVVCRARTPSGASTLPHQKNQRLPHRP